MVDLLKDAVIDTLKILPYLLITFIILEFFEHKLVKNNSKILAKNKKYAPFIGSVLGAFPQCGFSTMASSLYSNGIITIGTLIAIFLSTSDEMLVIMLGSDIHIIDVLKIILLKVVIGIIFGYLIDYLFKRKNSKSISSINHLCEKEHCSCENHNIFISGMIHAFKTMIFILIANLLINGMIHFIGDDVLTNFLIKKNILKYFVASLVGLIPNCASSIIITKLYLSNLISFGSMLSGLLTGSGLGILVLFKYSKNIKENIFILFTIYFIGVVTGIICDLI